MNELNEAQHANRITTTTSIIWHWYIFRHHLALPSEADSHFRAVCRALVTEAVELTSFMEKVSSSNSQVETDSELGQLDIQDWVRICKYFSRIHFVQFQARLWVQVIHELRSGVRLKKTEFTRTPIEYELTPYEILMDDIRSKRYKLNKVGTWYFDTWPSHPRTVRQLDIGSCLPAACDTLSGHEFYLNSCMPWFIIVER